MWSLLVLSLPLVLGATVSDTASKKALEKRSILPFYGGGGGYGVMPYGMGGYGAPFAGGAGIYPLYGGMMGGGNYGNHINGLSNYYGNNGLYANNMYNGYGRNAMNGMSQTGAQGLQGYTGAHSLANGNQGNQGYQNNALGNQYNQGAGGYNSNTNNHNTAAMNGYGGMGNLGHNRGHKTSGFHKSYHNVESGKDTKYVDEDHDLGQQQFGNMYDNNYANNGYNGYNGGMQNGNYANNNLYNTGGYGGASSQGHQNSLYNTLGHNGLYNNHDNNYQNMNLLSNRNNQLGYGMNNAGMNGMGGSHYNYYPMMY